LIGGFGGIQRVEELFLLLGKKRLELLEIRDLANEI